MSDGYDRGLRRWLVPYAGRRWINIPTLGQVAEETWCRLLKHLVGRPRKLGPVCYPFRCQRMIR